MRIDVHVHSKFSKRPSQWILQKIGCPESFTEPLTLYQIAKSRGMSHVTISDHNTIDGALAIAHLPGTFISEEITTYFPESGCKVHVLALNINESQHWDIQKVRSSIFDLAIYLKEQNILSVVAHPLYAVNDKLTLDDFEKMLLLFENFELNGARNARENETLRKLMGQLHEKDIADLAEKHSIEPLYPISRQKRLWGGSDDHSALNIARTYTRIKNVNHPQLLRGDGPIDDIEAICRPATPLTMAHNLYGIAYQYYCSKFGLGRYRDKDELMRFLDRNLRVDYNRHPGLFSRLYLFWNYHKEKKVKEPVSDSLMSLLRHETSKLIHDDPRFFEETQRPVDDDHQEKRWYAFVNRTSKRVMVHFGDNLMGHLSGANFFNIFSTIGSAGGLYTLMAPYFVAYAQFAKDRVLNEQVKERFERFPDNSEKRPFRMAHFTDTYYEVNGVAKTLQQQVHYALKNKMSYRMVTCYSEEEATDQPGVRNFKPIGTYELPEYPELKINYPPFLEMLAYCYDEEIDHIHAATPGPVGLAALAISKILKLPISGTYHTAIPQYAQILTGDESIEEITWKYVLWYYDQLDVVYAPSTSFKDELAAKGLDSKKIKLYPRGIDIVLFNPAKRNGIFQNQYPLGQGTKLLYVGRVSKEKNLELLVNAFKKLVKAGEKVQLVVVGDGPYREEMCEELINLPCCFTGYLENEKLASVYASSDLFVFPSTTDTFGNVVLEAQASGLPVIVSDQGGPCENMIHGQTGLICRSDDVESLLDAIQSLLSDTGSRRAMGKAARGYVEQRSFENAFLKMWELYQDPDGDDLVSALA